MKHWTCTLVLAFLGVACAAPSGHEEQEVSLVYEDTSMTASSSAIDEADGYFQEQNWEMAVEAYQEVTAADPNHGRAWHHLGYALHVLGKLEQAIPAHIKAANSSDAGIAGLGAYNAACAYSLLGDKDKAIEWLGQSIEVGFRRFDAFENDPDLDNIRTHPRFDELLEWAEQNPAEEKKKGY